MSVKAPARLRQLVDWRAAVIAGVVAGAVFLVLQMILFPLVTGGAPWVVMRMIAAIVMGEGVLPPPADFDPVIFLVALLVNFALSILFALILAVIVHRWGLLVGVIGGALFGLAVYAINFYTFSFFFPWFFPVRSWIDVLTLVIYGAVAGGVYEALEVERFVPV
ncbi:MAG: hypothetical protein L0332_16935 [Chloroflexi bacterium]|nr:hypothetical protein [Chloroflexota bacterium]MCI0581018.1 hypothetical protein [Chloroflexota bacterium]MCI0646357.1 hypothetical protein [Chloroflexota bacterium]MCI0728385.1 hypothetical protein [Chloroflexota bacterium]